MAKHMMPTFKELLEHALASPGNARDEAKWVMTFDLESGGGPAVRDLLEDATEAPVIELVNQLLRATVRGGASDLHVEPYEDGLRARVRVDGMLRTVLDRSDVPVRRVISRLKVMASIVRAWSNISTMVGSRSSRRSSRCCSKKAAK